MLNRAFKSAELAINDLSKTNANHSTLQKWKKLEGKCAERV